MKAQIFPFDEMLRVQVAEQRLQRRHQTDAGEIGLINTLVEVNEENQKLTERAATIKQESRMYLIVYLRLEAVASPTGSERCCCPGPAKKFCNESAQASLVCD